MIADDGGDAGQPSGDGAEGPVGGRQVGVDPGGTEVKWGSEWCRDERVLVRLGDPRRPSEQEVIDHERTHFICLTGIGVIIV